MDLKLRREVPVFKRCCFCLPLRRGLIGWGYARLGLNIVIILYTLLTVFFILIFANVRYALGGIALLSFCVIDVAFTILLLIAAHTKNSKLLRISYLYSIAWVILVLASSVYGVINDIFRKLQYKGSHYRFFRYEVVTSYALLFTVVFVQIYMILLTRSEAIKLQNQSLEIQFVNNAAEAEARCVSVQQRYTENGHTSVQYTDDRSSSVKYMDDTHDLSVKYTDNGHDSSEQQEPIQNGNKSDIPE